MYQKQVYLKNGAAVACITATTSGEDKTDEVLSAFRGQELLWAFTRKNGDMNSTASMS